MIWWDSLNRQLMNLNTRHGVSREITGIWVSLTDVGVSTTTNSANATALLYSSRRSSSMEGSGALGVEMAIRFCEQRKMMDVKSIGATSVLL